ncbi:hypothetical protein DPMN_038785 [Dreissena polymorpha]|uniref:Fibronectin type-III domain-containing protein n=1 Tax=Dreissena polymorpha TaxID=45954 RepID=A0A9D4MHP0_DREPO|nr:hypothetical protein DPMN_038785 [Dreissena polymorpha]
MTTVPSEPRDIKVSVAWQPPAQPNGHISSYTVYYSSMPEKDEWLQLSAMITFKEQDTQIYYIKLSGPVIGFLSTPAQYRLPQYIHGNGHIPSNGNGHAHHPGNLEGSFITGDYELDTYTPMLPENEQSDSKGGGTGNVILTPNGAKLNGFLPLKKNGLHNGRHNGHMKSFGNPLYSEETKGLIAEMLSGSPRTSCLPVTMGDERFTRSHCEDSGSLDNIDNSSTEGVLQDAPQEVLCGERAELDSGEGSWSYSSSDRNSTGYINSVPHSDMIDAGESVVFCGDSGVHVPTDGEGLIGLDECDGHFEGHGCYVSGQGDERGHGEVRSYGDGHGSVGNVRLMYSAVIDGRLPEQRTVWNVRGGDAAMSSFKPSVVTDGSGGSSHHVDLKHQADDRFAHTMAGDTASPVKDIPQSTPTSVTRKDTSNHRDTDFRESRQEANQKSAAPLLVQSDVGMLVRVQAPASRGVDIYQESHSFSPGTTLPQLPQLRVSTSLSPSQVGSHTPESVRGLGPHLTSPTYSVISCNGSIPSSVASHSSQNVRSDGVHESSRRPRLEENHSNLRNSVPLQVKQKNRSVKSSAQGYVQGGMPIESSSGVQQVAPMARISPSFVHGGVSTSESGEGVSSREVTVHCERDTTTLPQETVLSGNRVFSHAVLDAEM